MNGNGQFYDYNCHALLNKQEAEEHRKSGHDVDTKPQSYYEEIERAGGL